VHGDLWGGNASVLADGRGALIDPACWWADREVDLAMTRLFGGFSTSFYDGYQQEWPLDANYQDRIDVYNLYHLLNHANLFGGSYEKQCLTALSAMRSMLL
jgi:fructosamine-3-kinase